MKNNVSKQVDIKPYQGQYSQAITELFYQAVHNIDTQIYNAQQKQAWAPYPINYQKWQQRLIATQPTLLFKGQTLIGFIEFDNQGYIDCLYISPQHQQQGYATLLIKHILDIAMHKQIKQVSVDASIIAKPMFEKLGFTVQSENQQVRSGVTLKNYSMLLNIEQLS